MPTETKEEKAADNGDNFFGYRILLAEDVDINREIVVTLVEPTRLKIDIAENGRVAVEKFSKSPDIYDLILMDLQMPEMDGFEATRKIRAIESKLKEKESASFSKGETRSSPKASNLHEQIPIIAMTANVFREDIEKCLDAGMIDHIGKPLDVDEFFRMLRKYLTKRSG